ncbi:MAG TPA: hypothetical protein DIW43_01700 [Spongiibacteraceae bacterium]|nr:hypothetical protein [Spongiibacteraceae bacterium]HCS26136.1 hypothetical protein [Spongiibacteraceae bacterium]
MKHSIHVTTFTLFSNLVLSTANGYELGTHARLTQVAVEKSVVSQSTLLADLGISQTRLDPVGNTYNDMSGSLVRVRQVSSFEARYIPLPDEEMLTVPAWIMRGAVREDDSTGEDNPQDDPFNSKLYRPLNHFFDPINNRPLTVPGIGFLDADIHTAPAWATGTTNDNTFSRPNTAESDRRNHFTVFDAREAMYRALSGRNSEGEVVASSESDRNQYWATTFRSLGNVVHLIQDMAQPQHTRNDQHAGKFPEFLTGHSSVYEKYIEARATGVELFDIDGQQGVALERLRYGEYEAPTFDKFSDFWSTSPGVGASSGRGLADYSNRSFFTAGQNLGSGRYALPSNNADDYTHESTEDLLPRSPRKRINFLRGGPEGIRMTTESLFDYFLFNTPRTYSLNRFNYNDQADLLVPRAIAYSKNLIDYFFRGKIDLEADPNSSGAYVVKNYGMESMRGAFGLYYDDSSGQRHLVPGTGPDSNSDWADLAVPPAANSNPGRSAPLTFQEPTNPPPAAPGKYVLVFRGQMGEEADAVVGRVLGDALYVLEGDGGVTRLSSYSNKVNSFSIPVRYRYLTTGLSVYGGRAFYSVNQSGDTYSIPNTLQQYGVSDATLTDLAVLEYGNGTAVYSGGLISTDLNETATEVMLRHFDVTTGNEIGSFSSNPGLNNFGGYVDVAANSTHIATTHNEHLFIYTKSGAQIAVADGINIATQDVTMNSDRVYVIDGVAVRSYDLNGIRQANLSPGPADWFYIEAIEATDKRLYVVTLKSFSAPDYKLHVYAREVERDAEGRLVDERYVYQKAIDFSLGARWYPLSIGADRAL